MKPDFTINRLKRMAVYARVVELGSMSAAARELQMTASAVSQQIRQLEAETGVTLLLRSTRRLGLTEAGQAYYEDCARMLHAAQAAERRLSDLRDEPRGELRIAFPVGFSATLAAALAPLLRTYPKLALRLFAEDRRIDLIGERIDLAIRIGSLADSSLVARRLAEWRHLLVAAPAYAQAHGLPRNPEELTAHAVLNLSVLDQPEFIELHRPGEPARRIRVSGPVAGNSAEALRQTMLQGLGIMRLPGPDAAPLIAAGHAVAVLPDWSMAPIGVYALTAQRDSQPAKVRAAIAALRDHLEAGAGA
ncbi:LysR family transcriptional regulator [Marilutibacter chinensis]|uniref:LysR family transcriptional regulator n=1 Tax=Marilutibacter chinensis TaxID=2912247 RepID=A0ABS9HUC7_9GAMM|nr:LysR family transcriptional regulator [Lysobacter chinensis]MCF7221780.1 LysR family transcriptional regulator [Lysobacter chinensis]MCF7223716.1 LysR family transcriptional regulator [Lysobacter chinensis]